MGFPRQESWEWLSLLTSSLVLSVTPNEFLAVIMVEMFVVQSLSCVRLFVTPWTRACQASLSTDFLLTLTSTELVMPSSSLILSCPLLLLPSVFPSVRVFSSELTQIYVCSAVSASCFMPEGQKEPALGTCSSLAEPQNHHAQ